MKMAKIDFATVEAAAEAGESGDRAKERLTYAPRGRASCGPTELQLSKQDRGRREAEV